MTYNHNSRQPRDPREPRSVDHYINKKERREQRRAAKRAKEEHRQQNSRVVLLDSLKEIEPVNSNQELVFNAYDDEKHLALIGCPGTGKTFLSLYLALTDLLSDDCPQDKIIIVRSTVQGRDQGFLPGNAKDKSAMFEEPYEAICDELFGRTGVYASLKQQNKIIFKSTSFIRGTQFDNAIVIFDEFQNCTDVELHSVITRVAKGTRLICSGDSNQNDLKREDTGFFKFMAVANRMPSIEIVEFGVNDIVRSGFVREYMIARHALFG
jgi:phosphate starvation-inducible protein PhoH